MICTSCETENDEESTVCSNCGVTLETVQEEPKNTKAKKVEEPTVAAGCLVLIFSIFMMPIKTAKMAKRELLKIAGVGALDIDKEFPHLFWCKSMLPVIATALSAIVFLVVLGAAAATAGIIGLIAGLIVGPIAAVATDWFIMIVGEYMVIKVVSGRYYTQRIEEHEKSS